MNKSSTKKTKKIVDSIEKKYGVDLQYKTDKELHDHLKKSGVPSLSRLLKIVHQ
ncbi:MAG: hypothetical protein H6779_03375 [Candidatus Nomurabacteria bacterium]|nr:hypothetical protein [Candidatus Nomurabacteria bacterium]USN87429.1 MAG: hypothetical protein H6779_03375 [Candidatus Nomurabacteria bacterium]